MPLNVVGRPIVHADILQLTIPTDHSVAAIQTQSAKNNGFAKSKKYRKPRFGRGFLKNQF
jgi:hypothetical protein